MHTEGGWSWIKSTLDSSVLGWQSPHCRYELNWNDSVAFWPGSTVVTTDASGMLYAKC